MKKSYVEKSVFRLFVKGESIKQEGDKNGTAANLSTEERQRYHVNVVWQYKTVNLVYWRLKLYNIFRKERIEYPLQTNKMTPVVTEAITWEGGLRQWFKNCVSVESRK